MITRRFEPSISARSILGTSPQSVQNMYLQKQKQNKNNQYIKLPLLVSQIAYMLSRITLCSNSGQFFSSISLEWSGFHRATQTIEPPGRA